MKVLDLFAGCGGLSLGFQNAGFEVAAAVEYDKEIAKTFAHNHYGVKLYIDDIGNVVDKVCKNNYDVIIGGPPCQGFSMAGARIRKQGVDDARNYLFRHYINIVAGVKPQAFIMENVAGLTTIQNGKIFSEIVETFSSMNYNIYHKIFNVKDFGISQSRERLIIFGFLTRIGNIESYIDETIKKIQLTDTSFFVPKNVWDSISDLENYNTMKNDKNAPPNHTQTKHSKVATERMGKVKCGDNFESLGERINSVHSGSYGRLSKDKTAPTITTRFDTPSGGMFIHPTLNRTITPREAARIQSFPDNFEFLGNKTSICKQIGNSVPPKFAYFLGKLVREVLSDDK